MIAKNCALLLLLLFGKEQFECPNGTISTFSGRHAPKWEVCPGNLIFEDNFTFLDMSKWEHELTLRGGEVSFNCVLNSFNTFWSFRWKNFNGTSTTDRIVL